VLYLFFYGTTTELFGAHGGRITNGATSAASRQYIIAIVQVLLVLRLLRLQMNIFCKETVEGL